MPYVLWKESLCIGIEKIDAQHKQMIDIVNSVLFALKNKKSEPTVEETLKKLREYTIFHFKDEEALMEKINYPRRNKHIEEHSQLKQRVKMFQTALFHGEKVTLKEIKVMLSDWLLEHILRSDMDIAKFLKENPNSIQENN